MKKSLEQISDEIKDLMTEAWNIIHENAPDATPDLVLNVTIVDPDYIKFSVSMQGRNDGQTALHTHYFCNDADSFSDAVTKALGSGNVAKKTEAK